MILPHPTPYDALLGPSTLYGEARGEPREGQIGVAWVIVNRCRHAMASVPAIVLAPKQFSCWDMQDWRSLLTAPIHDFPVWEHLTKLWVYVLEGAIPDPTGGARHYCVETAHPYWRDDSKLTVVLGHQAFFAGIA